MPFCVYIPVRVILNQPLTCRQVFGCSKINFSRDDARSVIVVLFLGDPSPLFFGAKVGHNVSTFPDGELAVVAVNNIDL